MKYKLLIILGVFLVSFASIFVKLTDVTPSVIAMYRLGIAGFILLPFALKNEGLKKLKLKDGLLILFAGFIISLHYITWFTSLGYTSVTSSTLIICLEPLVALAFGFVLYREKIARMQFIFLIIALCGVSIVAWGDIHLSNSAIFGDFLTFIAVIFFVIYLNIGQKVVKKHSFVIYTSFLFITAAVILFLFNLFSGQQLIHYSGSDWIFLILIAIIPNAGQLIFNYTLRYVKSSLIATSILLEPIFATILAVIILKDHVFYNHYIGGIIIIISVYLYITLDEAKA